MQRITVSVAPRLSAFLLEQVAGDLHAGAASIKLRGASAGAAAPAGGNGAAGGEAPSEGTLEDTDLEVSRWLLTGPGAVLIVT